MARTSENWLGGLRQRYIRTQQAASVFILIEIPHLKSLDVQFWSKLRVSIRHLGDLRCKSPWCRWVSGLVGRPGLAHVAASCWSSSLTDEKLVAGDTRCHRGRAGLSAAPSLESHGADRTAAHGEFQNRHEEEMLEIEISREIRFYKCHFRCKQRLTHS